MTVCICCDAQEKILQQNAFAYDKWSVSHFLPVTSPNVHRFLKLFHHQTQQWIRTKVITEWPTIPQTCSYTTLWFVVDNDACIKFSLFSDMDVSQGSSATPLRCGGIVNDDFVAYLLVNLSVKNIWKSVNIWRSYGQYCSALFFLTHSVVQNTDIADTQQIDRK